jgi:hypothetical protein
MAAHARNRRDRFSQGSPHADEAVQEIARIEGELRRRRELRRAEAELEAMRERPYASACGEADAVADRIASLKADG